LAVQKALEIHDLKVEEHCIEYVLFVGGNPAVMFGLIAFDDEGKKLEEKLRILEKETALRFLAMSDYGQRWTGFCDIKNLKIEKDESKAPVRYKFTGGLWVHT
jgi:hypothetical protein